jgi:hypothetical protein
MCSFPPKELGQTGLRLDVDVVHVLQLEKRLNEVVCSTAERNVSAKGGRPAVAVGMRSMVQGTATAKGCPTLCASLVVSFAR